MQPSKQNIPIVFLGSQMEVAGAQRMLISQARWFQKAGYPASAVFFYDKQGLEETWQAANQFPLVSLQAKKPGADPVSNVLRLMRSLWRLFRLLQGQAKAVVAFTPHSNLLGLPVAWLAGVPVRIGTHHGHIEGSSRLLSWLHGHLVNSRLCSAMVAVSSQVKDYAIREEGCDARKIVMIENGIEPIDAIYGDPSLRKRIRKQLGFGEEDFLVLTVGRLAVQKGHTYLLEAIPKIVFRYPKLHFLFAGDGPLRGQLETQAKKNGVSERVRFLGIRDDVGELLSASDAFVQPSLWEGLSLALLEALMAGVPVLATSVEGVVDVVEHEKSALLVPPKDAAALSDALRRLVEDEDLRMRLSSQGQTRAEKSYSIDTMCRSYEKLILGLLVK